MILEVENAGALASEKAHPQVAFAVLPSFTTPGSFSLPSTVHMYHGGEHTAERKCVLRLENMYTYVNK